jgi:predicted permease
MEQFRQDVLFAARTLFRNPAFTGFLIVTLSLGIGASTAVFTLVNAVLLRPLSFHKPDRIVLVWGQRPDTDRYPISIPDFIDIQSQNRSFAHLAAVGNWNANLSGDNTPERVQGLQASGGFFEVLGARAEIGRTFSSSDTQPGSPRVVVLSHGFWVRHFAADPRIIGQNIRLNGDSYSIVGVLPVSFVYRGVQDDVIVPLVLANDPRRDQRGNNFVRTFGRLKDGLTIEQAKGDLQEIVRRLQRDFPMTNSGKPDVRVELLLDSLVGNVRGEMSLLLAAVLGVLMIACANLACLLLVRASTRLKEVAIRVSLGASRLRLMRELLLESILIALVGGGLGICLAIGGTHALSARIPSGIPRVQEISVDRRVLSFTAILSILCGCLFGLTPALELSKVSINKEMKEGFRSASGSSAGRKIRQSLVVVQVAGSLTLLLGTALLLRSFIRLQAVEPGFNVKNVLVVRLALPRYSYTGRDQIVHFYDNLAAKAEVLPGVRSVAVANVVPTDGFLASTGFNIAGRGWRADQYPEAQYRMITPMYFQTMGIPLLAGRDFVKSDRADGAPVAVINEAFARKYWPAGTPIGEHLQIDDTQKGMRDVEIVGVVGNVHDFGLENDSPVEIYTPFPQVPPDTVAYLWNNMCWFLRTEGEPLGLAAAFKQRVKLVDPDVPAASTRTLEQYMEQSVAPRRFNLVLIGIFGSVALSLTVIGVYAVISYSVAQRTAEIGVRVALGAQRSQIFWPIVGEGLRLVAAGIVIGVIPALLLTRSIENMLYKVDPRSPMTYMATSCVLLILSALACYFPASRALRIDPAIVLRHE